MMRVCPILISLAIVAGVCLPGAAAAQDARQERTRSEAVVRAGVKPAVTHGRRLFAGVGINAYERSDIWERLDNAVNDVEAVKAVLEKFHFESPPGWVLVERERPADDSWRASTDSIWSLVDAIENEVQPDDSLVFFFAGHGTEKPITMGGEEVGRVGYLVPANVKGRVVDVERQYIQIEALLSRLANIDVRHVFVILDSCKSGLSLNGVLKQGMSRGDPSGSALDLMSRHSRHVMSSAMGDQDAADVGQASPKNSRFTGWLVAALERASRGESPSPVGEDDKVTATELFTFVRERVQEESNNRQTPRFGRFALDREGELVLTLERDPFDPLLRRAVEAFDRDDTKAFNAAVESGLALRSTGFGAEYLRYLRARQDGEPGPILASLRDLQRLAQAGEPIPSDTRMTRGDLRVALQQYEKICQRQSCAVAK